MRRPGKQQFCWDSITGRTESPTFFLRGALEITSVEVSPDNLKLDEKVWKEVEDTKNRYFRDQSILGWFLSLPGELEENDERILKTHLNHFGGNDKVLFRMEPNEKEEAFYIYDNGALKKLGGFYIYYEKMRRCRTI